MDIAIYTLGCKVNQYETQAMEQLLRQRGHETASFGEVADAYVVNSCSAGSGGSTRRRCWPCAAAIPRPIRRTWRPWTRT